MGFIGDLLSRFGTADVAGEIAAAKGRFDADPAYASEEAVRYTSALSPEDRSKYWTAPDGLFVDQGDVSSTFATIYGKGVWGGGSGGGSQLRSSVLYTAYLQHFIERHDVRSIVDLGCGDWQASKYLRLADRRYLGLDVVPSVIAQNTASFGSDTVRFQVADAVDFVIPNCDLLICKDVMQHLSNGNVRKILTGITSARWAIITNDFHPSNEDSRNGDTRPMDVTRPPFDLAATARLAFNGKVTFLVESPQFP